VVRTIREGKSSYGVTAFGKDKVLTSDRAGAAYARMLKDVIGFFNTGVPPVPNDETLELFSFMDAALRSKNKGGASTRLR
jgi:hypothetical protein